jgi:hypothetical protein
LSCENTKGGPRARAYRRGLLGCLLMCSDASFCADDDIVPSDDDDDDDVVPSDVCPPGLPSRIERASPMKSFKAGRGSRVPSDWGANEGSYYHSAIIPGNPYGFCTH